MRCLCVSIAGIWVQFKGEAKNKWKEETEISVGDVDVSYTSKNKAKEEYFDSVKVLFGAGIKLDWFPVFIRND